MMLGIVMNNNVNGEAQELARKTKFSEDGATPQKSILDFFKSPQKSVVTTKPKDLHGYFNSSGQKTTKTNSSLEAVQTQEKKENIQVYPNNGTDGKDKKKNRKRKRTESSNLDISTDDFDLPTNGKVKVAKGQKKKSKVKKTSEKSESETEEQNGIEKNVVNDSDIVNVNPLDNPDDISVNKQDQVKHDEYTNCVSAVDESCNENEEKNSECIEERKGDDPPSEVLPETATVTDADDKTDDVTIEERAQKLKSENKDGDGNKIKWKNTLDMDKIKTPNSKTKMMKDDKKKKKKKADKVKRTASRTDGEVNKSLNLSDICNNFADVSILSDDGKCIVSTNEDSSPSEDCAQINCNSMDATEENRNNETSENLDDIVGKVDGNTAKVTEISYSDFLLNEGVDDAEESNQKNDETERSDEKDEGHLDTKKKGGNKDNHLDTKKKDENNDNHLDTMKTAENDDSKQNGRKSRGRQKKAEESGKEDVKNKSKSDSLVNLDSNDNKDGHEKETSENDDIPMPKQYPSITNFFKKADKTKSGNQSIVNEFKKVTTRALVHSEPSPKSAMPEKSKDVKKSNSPTSIKAIDDEIQILGTEIITVDTPKRSCSKGHSEVRSKSPNEGMSYETQGNSSTDQNMCTKIKKEPTRKSLTGKFESISKTVPQANDSTGDNDDESDDKDVTLIADTHLGEDPSVIPQKTTQSTLFFGKSGLHMKSSHATRVRKTDKTLKSAASEKPIEKSTNVSKKYTKKKHTSFRDDIDLSESNVIDEIDGSKVKNQSHSERRKSLRLKYKVALLDETYKKGSPIRIKLTRCSASSSSQDDSFTPGSKKQKLKVKHNGKQAHAQKLLEKAKKSKKEVKCKSQTEKKKVDKKTETPNKSKKSKTKSDDNNEEEEDGSRRRSARLSDRHKPLEEVLIIDDNDDSMDSVYTPTKGKSQKIKAIKATPGRGRKATPKKETKSAKKLAPIFMKKQKEEDTKSPAKKVILDPEAEKLRRAFLMSGVPEELHRQTVAVNTVITADYPPFPLVNHVQQLCDVASKLNIWQLPSVSLKLKPSTSVMGMMGYTSRSVKNFNEMSKCPNDLGLIKKFTQHKKIDEESLTEQLLKEIKQTCPNYPVHKVYTSLKEKKDDDILDLADALEEQKTATEEKSNVKRGKKEEEKLTQKELKPRRSLRRRRKEVIEVVDLGSSPESVTDMEDNPSSSKDLCPPTLSFPEKYQPLQSSEIVGNQAVVKRLKSWLIEWKHVLNKEARKARLLLMKNSKNKSSKEKDESVWWGGDSSDFDTDSDDSDDDDDRLCNTVMLTGPTGIGKTTTVYALAQELGFKVFEVNASSCRNGKRILTQLQEATQSHQVSKIKDGTENSGTPSKTGCIAKAPEKKMPTAFANLFSKAKLNDTKKSQTEKDSQKTNTKSEKNVDTGVNKKRKREKDDHCDNVSKKKRMDDSKKCLSKQSNNVLEAEAGEAKGLNLSSTSLILFDDVDLVFEQDKGFWSAVQSFMSTTKIPILLTSNDTKLNAKFDGRFEHYSFKVPSLISSTVYLQLVCLVENMRTNAEDISSLLQLNNGDIRKSLLTLQYWVLSGGGVNQVKLALKLTSEISSNLSVDLLDENSCSQDMTPVNNVVTGSLFCENDDDDFVSIKPVTSRHRQIISEDESSNSCFMTISNQSNISARMESNSQSTEDDQLPVVHMSCVSSINEGVYPGCDNVLKVLKLMTESNLDDVVSTAVTACQQYRTIKSHLLYTHHLDFLSLPKVETDMEYLHGKLSSTSTTQKPKRRRIKLSSDLYDSENSNDSDIGDTNIQNKDIGVKTDNKSQDKEVCQAHIKSLSSFYNFYDTLSFTDGLRSLQCRSNNDSNILSKEHCSGSLVTGTSDQVPCCDNSDWALLSQLDGLYSHIEMRSYRRLYRSQVDILDTVPQEEQDQFSVPVLKGKASSIVEGTAATTNSSKSSIKRSNNDVFNSLPLSVHSQKLSVMLDYLPSMREIVRTEQLRKRAKAKRRFHHYFDNIGLPLKETTLNVLSSTFN